MSRVCLAEPSAQGCLAGPLREGLFCFDEMCGKPQHEHPRRASLTQRRLCVAVSEHAIREQHCKALEPCIAASASFSRAPVPSACPAAKHPLIALYSPRERAGSGQDTRQILYGVSHSQGSFMQLGIKMASVSITGSIWESWLLVSVPFCWFLSCLLPSLMS